MSIEVNAIKVTIPIAGDKLPRDILPPEGAPGSAKAIVSLTVTSGELSLTATLKAKTYKEVLKKIDACEHGGTGVLQGKLGSGGALLEAGFTVQASAPRREPVSQADGTESAPVEVPVEA